ncbi:MAG: adenylyltransferase [Candidatus Omnitrophica bacterium CG1_02_49_10]|nr:MAG: adenylyltransferase [Candidatus Omnitrophica bacterium CG1_02_49_10]
MADFAFTDEQIERYSRQMILSEIGGEGQKKISAAKVILIGAGGLGSPCAYYLAAAGVGTLGIVDSDKVEVNNLQRQIIHSNAKVGMYKAESAKDTLSALNPDIKVVPMVKRLTSENVIEVIGDYDIVVDGSDNFPTRYLMNDACVLANKPLVHGGILKFDGQLFTIKPKEGPCYRCLFSEPPPPGLVPSCQEAGILGSVAGVIGVLQASEVLKLILGKGELLVGRLLIYDALSSRFRSVNIRRNPKCPICGDNPTIKKLIDYEIFCSAKKGKEG